MGKVVFLDRDGVINEDSPAYIKSWSEFRFLPGSLEALRHLNANGFTTIVITNQSAVNRGLISEPLLLEIHDNMQQVAEAADGCIADIFFCPHRPDEACACRKPEPGLIHQAQRRHAVDLKKSWMIGDSVKDIECARRAGCGGTILVRTGNGRLSERILLGEETPPDYIAEDLLDAVHWILDRTPSES